MRDRSIFFVVYIICEIKISEIIHKISASKFANRYEKSKSLNKAFNRIYLTNSA